MTRRPVRQAVPRRAYELALVRDAVLLVLAIWILTVLWTSAVPA